jgi:restriction system protein
MALWRQRNLPSAAETEQVLQTLTTMNWRDFCALLETAFTRQGYGVSPLQGPADLLLEKKGVLTVVSAKRWKAAALGIETLRELVAERDRLQAPNSVCITLCQVSAKARDFAAQNRITLISNGDLVVLTAETFKTL